MVYYTLKFWLGDRVTELDNKTQTSGNAWLVTKADRGSPVLKYGDYRVVALPSGGVTSKFSS